MTTERKHGWRGHYVAELRNLESMLLLAKLRRAPRGALTLPLRWRAGRACSLAIRGGDTFRGSLPEALRLRGLYAWLTGNRSSAMAWWNRCRAICEQLGADHELALVKIEAGR